MLVFNGHDMSGPTANRPTNAEVGQPFFDTTLKILLIWNGTIWDPTGDETAFSTVAAAGTNQGTGGALVEGFNAVTGADGTKVVTLPVATAGGLEMSGYNASASSLAIYPGTSGTINGGSANAAITVAPNSKFSFVSTSATNWSAGYTAPTPAAYPTAAAMNASAQALTSSGTITLPTASKNLRVSESGNVTGMVLTVGTVDGQEITIINTSAFTITFAASSSNTALGSGLVVASKGHTSLIWSATDSLWY